MRHYDRPTADPLRGEGARPPILEVSRVSLTRGQVLALDRVSMRLPERGAVHALLGQNGSGKSSLLGVISGQLAPDAGTVSIAGERLSPKGGAHDALEYGVAMVSQELALAQDVSITENVLMGRLPRRRGRIDWPQAHERAAQVLARLGLRLDPRCQVRTLGPDQQQLVEIGRALATEARLLILDEPTSSLNAGEVEQLFATLNQLREEGVSTLLVSHRIPELYAICDSVTILRDGREVLTRPMSEVSPADLVEAMVGLPVVGVGEPEERVSEPGPVAMRATDLGVAGEFSDVGLSLRAGEVVGIAGLTGAGCSAVLRTLAGVTHAYTGQIALGGGEGVTFRGPRDALDAGVAYLPPDRKTEGLNLRLSIEGNLALPLGRNRSRFLKPSLAAEHAKARELTARTTLKSAGAGEPVANLSGGNQQKVAIGRCLVVNPKVLLLDDPTRGVDVSARAEIHQLLRDLAIEGSAVLVSSSDNEELVELCDRVVVMAAGRVVGEIIGADLTEAAILSAAGGSHD